MEEQEKLSFLELQGEAVLALSLCVKQYPGVPQGFKLQREALLWRLPQLETQPVEEAAAAVEVHHVRVWKEEKNKRSSESVHDQMYVRASDEHIKTTFVKYYYHFCRQTVGVSDQA